VRATAYLYPWDVLGDPAAAERVAALGVRRVALAAVYHAVRASTPRHPARRVVDARHAAFYLPVRPEAWHGRPVAPRPATAWTGHEDAFGAARAALAAHGLAVDAWVVLTHTAAGPDHAERNAFGDLYPYALCPASGPVREYARTLVAEVLDLGGPDGLMVEACGPMGLGHQGAHEKTAGADWSVTDEGLLSLCFCAACGDLMRSEGLNPAGAAAAVRAAVGRGHPDLASALGRRADGLLSVRRAAVAGLRDAVLAAARDGGIQRLAMFADADPWATGPSAAVTSATDGVDVYLAAAWGPASEAVARLRAMRAAVGPVPRLGAYVNILPPTVADPDLLAAHWRELRDGGADELHLYHAGLASTARLTAAARALRTIGQ
jgi:hypothetical protein